MYGYMFSCTINAIKATNYLYDVHYYSLNKCIFNYAIFGLGTLFIVFVFITIIIISYNVLKTKKK